MWFHVPLGNFQAKEGPRHFGRPSAFGRLSPKGTPGWSARLQHDPGSLRGATVTWPWPHCNERDVWRVGAWSLILSMFFFQVCFHVTCCFKPAPWGYGRRPFSSSSEWLPAKCHRIWSPSPPWWMHARGPPSRDRPWSSSRSGLIDVTGRRCLNFWGSPGGYPTWRRMKRCQHRVEVAGHMEHLHFLLCVFFGWHPFCESGNPWKSLLISEISCFLGPMPMTSHDHAFVFWDLSGFFNIGSLVNRSLWAEALKLSCELVGFGLRFFGNGESEVVMA